MKNEVVVNNFKIKKIKNYNSKISLGISLELLRAVWGQFSFSQFLVPAYTSQGLQAPSNVVSVNYRVLICCSYHFQSYSLFFLYFGLSVCKSLQCLISALTQEGKVQFSHSVMSERGQRWSFIKAHLFNCAVGREEHWGVLAVSGPHWVCPRSWRVCFPSLHYSGSRLLCRGTV